ncbi:MAG: hypothetical protein VYA84_14200 [Planctomycetota bacterium]|nr:hypothetical protein [Planctomycetota bacterium]
MDPIKGAEYEAMGYERWSMMHVFAIAPASSHVGNWLQCFSEFPLRRAPGSFNLNDLMESITK